MKIFKGAIPLVALLATGVTLTGCGETPKRFARMTKDLMEGKVTPEEELGPDNQTPVDVMFDKHVNNKSWG